MRFNPKKLLVLVGFGVLRATASSADGGAWSHFAEARTTVATLLGVVGFLRDKQNTAASTVH